MFLKYVLHSDSSKPLLTLFTTIVILVSKLHTTLFNNIITFLEKWLSFFIHDCPKCQRIKHFNQHFQKAPVQSFSEHAPSFNYRISLDTKGPINHPSQNNSCIHVTSVAFSHFVVSVPVKSNNA